MRVNKLWVMSFFMLVSTVANAGFVNTDWKVLGDAKAVLHEETGIEWMNMSITKGMSVNGVLSQMEEGEAFAGWRLPKASELSDMMTSFFENSYSVQDGIRSQTYGPWDPYQGDSWEQNNRDGRFQSFWGMFGLLYQHSNYDYIDTRSIAVDEHGNLTLTGVRKLNDTGGVNDYRETTLNVVLADEYNTLDYANANRGVWLVNDGGVTLSSKNDPSLNINNPNAPVNAEDVSEPYMWFSLSVFGLMLAGRRKGG